jgi:hypothetical protein
LIQDHAGVDRGSDVAGFSALLELAAEIGDGGAAVVAELILE